MMDRQFRYRSLFWPVILIGVGLFWLLANTGMLSGANLYQIWRLWPLLLIAGGVDLLLRRTVPYIGALIGVAVLAVAAFFLFGGVTLPGAQAPEVKTERFTLPGSGIQNARISLDLWSDPAEIHPVRDGDQLIDANITHTGEVEFNHTGTGAATVQLSRSAVNFNGFPFFSPANLRTDIGLSTRVPLDLAIDAGSGSTRADLQGLQLTAFALDSGSGSVVLVLPQAVKSYSARINSGSGSVQITLPADTALDVSLDSGSGSVDVQLPAGSAVQIEVRDAGSGSVSVPGTLTRSSGDGKEGIWETTGYSSAARKLNITVQHAGSGSLHFH